MNDLVVSNRQKHNGMSWSKDGAIALASITALKKTRKIKNGLRKKNSVLDWLHKVSPG